MKRNKYIERSFVMLTFATALLFLFTVGGAAAYENVWKAEDRLPEGAEISGVDVSGLALSEAKAKLQNAIEEWKLQSGWTLVLFDENLSVSHEALSFQMEETIDAAKAGGKTTIQATIHEKAIKEYMDDFSFSNVEERVVVSQITDAFVSAIDLTANEPVRIDVSAYIEGLEEMKFNPVVLPLTTSPQYFQEWVGHLDGYKIEGREDFSLLQALEESGAVVFDDPNLDKLASALLQALARTNFTLLERHIHTILPDGMELGEDAEVKPGDKGLRFYNPNMHPYTLNVSVTGNQLNVSLYGYPFLHTYSLETENVESISPRTIVRFNENRARGDHVTLSSGKDGQYGDLLRVERNMDGEVVEEKLLSQEYYPPKHRLEEWSLRDNSDLTEEIPEEEWQSGERTDSKSSDKDEENQEPDEEKSNGNEDDGNKNENEDTENNKGWDSIIGPDGERQPIKGYD